MLKYLGKFWKFVTYLRSGIANFIFIVVVGLLLIAIFSADKKPLPDSAPLLVAISGQLVDQLTYQPSVFDLIEESRKSPETLMRDVTYAINHAAEDTRISALILDLNGMRGGSFSKLEELGQAISNFKKTGKSVIAYADQYSQQQYFLASYADTIYLHSYGNVSLTGFAYYGSYFKEAADKLSIKFHLFKVGNYKDAAEPFIRNSMSDASREHNTQWINELWGRYTSAIEAQRNLPDGSIKNFIESLNHTLKNTQPDFSSLALDNGLVDEVLSRIALDKLLLEKFGEDEDSGFVNAIAMQRYLDEIKPHFPQAKNNIGLIVASGNIVDGNAPEGQIGGDTLSGLIQQASDDDSLKALIIRVDSGGGSAFASEIIREKIANARENGLPIYISMGSVAASGGYWLATAADEIWALPTTITGSIGVWGLVPNFSAAMNRLGIHSDGFGTTPISDIYQVDRPLSEDSQQVFQSGVDSIYRRFIALVAEARDQSPEDIHKVAQGRVWTGQKALELGLVDQLGTLDDLVHAISQKYSIQHARLKLIERPLSTSEQFMRALLEEASVLKDGIQSDLLGKDLATLAMLVRQAKARALPSVFDLRHGSLSVYAHCIACLAP